MGPAYPRPPNVCLTSEWLTRIGGSAPIGADEGAGGDEIVPMNGDSEGVTPCWLDGGRHDVCVSILHLGNAQVTSVCVGRTQVSRGWWVVVLGSPPVGRCRRWQ